MSRLKLFIPLIVCLVLGVFFYIAILQGKDPNELPSALIDKPVPVFNLPRLVVNDGEPQDFVNESIFKGEPSLLNVWATWCAPCREEHPFLNQLAEQGVKIIGINYKDEPGMAKQWLIQGGNPYVVTVMDFYGRFGIDLGVFGAPETYLVDGNGVIRYKHIGILNQRVWEQDFLPQLTRLDK